MPSELDKMSMNNLNKLDDHFASISQRVASLDRLIDPQNIESLFEAAEQLKHIILELQDISEKKVFA